MLGNHLSFHSSFCKLIILHGLSFLNHRQTMKTLFYIFFGLFLLCKPVCALQQASLFRNLQSFVNHGNFIPDLFHYLSATKITSILVKDDSDCPFECIGDRNCFSLNVAAFADSQGLYLCELLDKDRYKARNKLQANASFHHYSPWVS